MYIEKRLDYEQAKNKALKILEYRTHSEREIYDKLKRAGAKSGDIENVLEFLREYNFVNDKDFALRYAKDLKNLKKLGKRRVKAELMKKGIPSELAENTLEEIEWEEEDILYPLIKKKLAGDFEKKSIDRCVRYFIYKGYDFDDIKQLIERIKSEEDYGL